MILCEIFLKGTRFVTFPFHKLGDPGGTLIYFWNHGAVEMVTTKTTIFEVSHLKGFIDSGFHKGGSNPEGDIGNPHFRVRDNIVERPK